MADIVLSVDFSTLKQAQSQLDKLKAAVKGFPVNSLVSGLSGLEGKIKQLVDAQSRGTISAKQYNLGLLDVKRAYEQLGLSSQQATSRVRAYAAELQRQAAAKEAARAAKELARAQEEAARATAQMAARQQELKIRFQDGYAAFVRYRKDLTDLRAAYAANIISADRYKAKLLELKNAHRTFAASQTATGANSRGLFAQQLGYQVGDFFVQVQSGTNAMVAFGQQATQLVGFLPAIAGGFGLSATAALGLSAALGIIIPIVTLLGYTWMKASEESNKAKKETDRLKESLASLDAQLQDWIETKQAASLGITVEELISTKGLDKATSDLEEAKRKLDELVASMAEVNNPEAEAGLRVGQLLGFLPSQADVDTATQAVEDAQTRLANVQKKLDDERQQAFNERLLSYQQELELQKVGLQYGNDSVEYIKTQNAQALANLDTWIAANNLSKEQAESLRNSEIYAGNLKVALFEAGSQITEAQAEAKLLEDGLSQAAIEALRLSGIDITSGISSASLAAASLAANLGIALSDAISLQNLRGSMNYSGRGGDPRQFMDGGSASYSSGTFHPFDPSVEVPKKSKGGGGGGSKTDPMAELLKQAKRQEQLLGLDQQQIALKKELWRIEDALGKSASKYSTEKLTAIAKENLAIEAQLKLQEEHQKTMENLANTIAGSVGDAFMSIVDGTSSVKDAFKQMAADIIKQLLQVLVVQRLVGSWNASTGVGSGLAGFFGKLLNFEGGGYTGSGGRSGGLDGKGGFLAMVHPDETIIDHTKRKQVAPAAKPASVGSSEAPVVVNQYFNLSANGDDSVRRIVKEEAPKLAQQAKAAVLDARRRGGSYGKAF